MKFQLAIGLFFLISFSAICQNKEPIPGQKFLVAGFSAVSYKGSLSSGYTRWTPAYQLGLQFKKRKLINGQISLTFGQFIGEDRSYRTPTNAKPGVQPLSKFKTDFISLAYEAQILLFEYQSFRIMASAGVGFFRFIPKDWEGNSLTERDRTRNPGESYNSISLSIPAQIAVRYSFSNNMSFGLQAGWYNTTSKYLDNMDELSNNSQSDNIAFYRFQFQFPLQ